MSVTDTAPKIHTVHWAETTYNGQDPSAILRMIQASKCTGQLVLHVSQGVVCLATWRERDGTK